MSDNIEAQLNGNPAWTRQRKWKIVFFTLTFFIVFFFVLGGALVGTSLSCGSPQSWGMGAHWAGSVFIPATATTSGGGDCGKYYGGAALVAIAGIAILPWAILLILRFTGWYSRLRSWHAARGTHASQYNNTGAAQTGVAQQQSVTEYKGPVDVVGQAAAESQSAAAYCGNCEKPVQGAFCGHCGMRQA